MRIIFTQLCLFVFMTTLMAQSPIGVTTVQLTGSQEALPVATRASGTVEVTIFDDFTISFAGSFANLSAPVATEINGGMHVHIGYHGQNGPVSIPLVIDLAADSLSGSLSAANNTFAAPAELINADLGQAYINLHTRQFPGGELRGIIATPDVAFTMANLLGSNEVTAVNTSASGGIYAELDGDQLSVTGSFQNLSSPLNTNIAGGAHLHIGRPGASGGVNIILSPTLDPDSLGGVFTSDDNQFTLNPNQISTFLAGGYYVNIHSLDHPGGEIRGQLLPQSATTYRVHLSGSNEWPVVNSAASGQVLLHYATDSTLRVTGTFSGLSSPVDLNIAGGAHLHLGVAGSNGGILLPLDITLNADSLGGFFDLAENTFFPSDTFGDLLLERAVYLNLHTENFASGELRGQALPESQYVYTAYLNGNQEIPAVLTAARGMAKLERNGNRMIVSGSFTDLGSDLNVDIVGGAHLHEGYAGQSGPILEPLIVSQAGGINTSGRFSAADNLFNLDPLFTETLTDRRVYLNIHSLDNAGGELRGQLLGEANAYFYAPLSSTSQTAFTPEIGDGMLAAEVNGSNVILSGSFRQLSSPFDPNIMGGMHLHEALAGENGGILAPINVNSTGLEGVILPANNQIDLDSAALAAMNERRIYANVHTTGYPSGEIRGQVLPLAGTYFHTSLRDVNTIPSVTSLGLGSLKLELTGNQLVVSGAVNELQSQFNIDLAQGAHLHSGAVDETGPIVIQLNPQVANNQTSVDWVAAENRFTLADSVVTALYAGNIYANVHTVQQPTGEIRGQIRGDINTRPTATTISFPADGASATIEGDGSQPFEVQWGPATDENGDSVVYVWQVGVDPEFTQVVFAVNTGTSPGFVIDFNMLDQLLEQSGVPVGETVNVFHRVITTDGSNHRRSIPNAISITRGVVVGTSDPLIQGFSATLFPSLGRPGQTVRLKLETEEAFSGQLIVTDQLGRPLESRSLSVPTGGQTVELATDRLPAGSYYVTLRLPNGKVIYATIYQVQ